LIHTGKTLPNVHHFSTAKVNEGEVYGVEPFVTVLDGAGEVKSGFEKHIFRFTKKRSLDNPYAKKLLNHIRTRFRTLPFTERWLTGIVPHNHYRTAFSTLLSSKTLMSYPTYIESRGKPVAQAEHTVIIVKGKCLVTTE
jgi:methionyl aminopeptidase